MSSHQKSYLNLSNEQLVYDDSPTNPKYVESNQPLLIENFMRRYSVNEFEAKGKSGIKNISSNNIKPIFKSSANRINERSLIDPGFRTAKQVGFVKQFSQTGTLDLKSSPLKINLNDEHSFTKTKSIAKSLASLAQSDIMECKSDLAKEICSKSKQIVQKRRLNYINYRSSVSVANQSRKQSAVEFQFIQNAIVKSFKQTVFHSYNTKLKYTEVSLGILSVINIASSLVDTQLFINRFDIIGLRVQTDELPPIETVLRVLNTLISLVMVALVFFRYKCVVRLQIADQMLSKYAKIFESALLKPFLLESFVSIIFYPPTFSGLYIGEVNQYGFVIVINAIFTLAVFFKIYHMFRLYRHYSMYSNFDAVSICNKFTVTSKNAFLLKAEIKARPLIIGSVILLSFMLLMSFSLRTFENGITDSQMFSYSARNFKEVAPGKGTQNLAYIYNSFWFIIQTITTVGYGDAYPKTHFGRAVGAIACIIGIFLISLITLSLAPFTELNSEERKAYITMKQIQLEIGLKKKAVEVIKSLLQLNQAARENRKAVPKLSLTNVMKEAKKSDENARPDIRKKKNLEKTNKLSKQFILFTKLKKNISVFTYNQASNKVVPLDELLLNMRRKLRSELGKFSMNVDQIEYLNKQVNELMEYSKAQQSKMLGIVESQNLIINFLISMNNSNYGSNIKQKLHPIFKTMKSKKSKNLYYRGSEMLQNKNPLCENFGDFDISLKRNAFTFSNTKPIDGSKYATTANLMGISLEGKVFHPIVIPKGNKVINRKSSQRISTQSINNEIANVFNVLDLCDKRKSKNRSFSDKSLHSFTKASCEDTAALFDSILMSHLETSAQGKERFRNTKDFLTSIIKDNCINEIKESSSRSLTE